MRTTSHGSNDHEEGEVQVGENDNSKRYRTMTMTWWWWWLGLIGLLLLFLVAAVLVAVLETNRQYNRNNDTNDNDNIWILVGGLTEQSATFRIRRRPNQPYQEYFVILQQQQQQQDEDDEPNNISTSFIVDWNDITNLPKERIVHQQELTFQEDPNVTDDFTHVESTTVTGLQPNTRYYYAVLRIDTNNNNNSNSDLVAFPWNTTTTNTTTTKTVVRVTGRFQTAPPSTTTTDSDPSTIATTTTNTTTTNTNFAFATAGCAWTGSQANVFRHVSESHSNLLFFLHLGDFHYEDIVENSVSRRIEAVDRVLLSSKNDGDDDDSVQAKYVYNTMALSYMWDDHDWLDNNSGAAGTGREAALTSYREAFPYHAPLPSSNGTSMYHAFTIGTVRFILSDLRSEAVPGQAMYSAEQRDWLFAQLAQASQYDFVIWISTKPWIGPAKDGDDSWMGFADDRQELSAYIAQTIGTTSQNLLVLASDAHMVAFDDGSNTDYSGSSNTTMSFPILQSGPLDRLGSAKGGPFSDGCTTYKYERNHQYSIIEFQAADTDNNNNDNNTSEPCLIITSYRVTRSDSREIILSKRLCGKIFAPANPGAGSCDEPLFSSTNWALIIVAMLLWTMIPILSCFVFHGGSGSPSETERDGGRCCGCVNNLGRYQTGSLVIAIVFILFFVTMLAAFFFPFTMGVAQFDTFAACLIGVLQLASVVAYLGVTILRNRRKHATIDE